MFASRVARGLQNVGKVAGHVAHYSTKGAELSRKLGTGAGQFQKSRLGTFVSHRSPMAGRILSGAHKYSPLVAEGLEKLSGAAKRVSELETIKV